MKKLILTGLLLSNLNINAQVYINEIDINTLDDNAKLFIELKSELPNYNLDHYKLLFIKQDKEDSSKNYLYYKIDLNNITTDDNGFLLIGNKNVDPYPFITFNTKIIENGPMIVGLYKGNDNLKLYEHNSNLKLIESFVYQKDESKLSEFYENIADYKFNDLDPLKSLQLNDEGYFVLDTPTPGYNHGYTIEYLEEEYEDILIDEKKFNQDTSPNKNHKTSKFYFPDGSVLEAYFPGEIHTGKGKFTFKNGDYYEGDIVNDEISGKGIFYYKNGDRYEGSFIKGKMNGRGTFYFTNGDRYEGFFKNDLFHGMGKLIKKNGEIEEGTFVEGILE